jgi:hypothetical protein
MQHWGMPAVISNADEAIVIANTTAVGESMRSNNRL